MSLTKLLEQKSHIMDMLLDADEDGAEALQNTLEGLEFETEWEIVAVCSILQDNEIKQAAIKTKMDRWSGRMADLKKQGELLKEAALAGMDSLGAKKILSGEFDITSIKGRPVAASNEPTRAPDEFIDTKVIQTPSKKRILDALKAGDKVDGWSLGVSKKWLKIK